MSGSEAGLKPALISVRPTTAESKWAGKECPHCKKPIGAGENAVLCPKCYTPHHKDCWTTHGNVCALDQTPANIMERAGRAAAPAAEAPAPAAPLSSSSPLGGESIHEVRITEVPPAAPSLPAASRTPLVGSRARPGKVQQQQVEFVECFNKE